VPQEKGMENGKRKRSGENCRGVKKGNALR